MSVIRAHWWWWGSHNGGEEGAITTNSGSSSCSWTTLALQTLSSLFIYSGSISFSLSFFFAFYLSLLCLLFLSRPLSIFLCSPSLLVNCPNQQSLLLIIVSLHWLSSWQWWPSIRGGRLYQPLWRPEIGDFTHFFCKSHKLHISRWRILFLPSCIWCILPSNTWILRTYHEFPKMGVTYSNPHFQKFVIGPQNTCIWGRNTPNTRLQKQNSPSGDM